MHVNELISCECSEHISVSLMCPHLNIHNSSSCSHPSEDESENCLLSLLEFTLQENSDSTKVLTSVYFTSGGMRRELHPEPNSINSNCVLDYGVMLKRFGSSLTFSLIQ